MARKPYVTDRDRGWKAIRKAMKEASKLEVAVGVIGDGAPRDDGEIDNATLLTMHEYGSPAAGIPARPVVRPTHDENRSKYRKILRAAARHALAKGKGISVALALLGQRVSSDIKRRIESGVDPANSPETIVAKGSSRPLIDTGQMKAAISYIVRRRRFGYVLGAKQ